MKTKTIAPLLAMLLAGTAAVSLAAGPNGNPGGPARAPARSSAAVAPLNAEEASHLIGLREEEKLARDVYLDLAERWQTQEFRNIARSEQRHFDIVGAQLATYGQIDPALPAVGQFADPEIQALYASLLASGNTSYVDALRVGATIEDMDIRDVLAAIEATSNPAVKRTYDSLLEASKNHLRAFVSRLTVQGATYEPQFIDEVLFDAIVGQ
jgi:hypothetical protein